MESTAENSRSVDRRTPAEPVPSRSWVSRIALVGSLLMLAYFVYSLPEQYARMQLAEAENLANDKKYVEALASLDSASRYLPKVPGIYIVKAKIYLEMGNKKAAEENLNLALPLLGDSYRELMMFADTASNLQLPDSVVKVCDKIDAAAPKHELEIHRQLLNTSAYCRAVVNRDCDKALKGIDRALSLPNGMPSLTVSGMDRAMFEDSRALILYRLGKNEEALVDINNAVAYLEKAYEREYGKPLPTPGAAETPKAAGESGTADSAIAEKLASEITGSGSQESAGKKESRTDSVVQSGPYKGMSKAMLKNWAVMFNHRQMIREALGDKAGAELDRQRIVEMGHTPGDDLH
jgi:tetratricopeptide (TPR) repeat protein